MSDIEEMVKRLRAGTNGWNSNPAMKAAADVLEAQAKRIAELEASLADSNEALQVMGLKLAQAEAENARLWAGHERYEIVRRLNAHQFTELFRESISKNKRFDDLVDALNNQSHSANTVGGPTPGAAPACASERSVSESIAAGHPCFDPDGPPDHDWKYVDDSFSHEFGTEICGHYECARCDAIKPE